MKPTRNIGSSILPSSCPEILAPIPFRGGVLQVHALHAEDTHALFHGDTRLASHPNGYSCHSLAKRIIAGDRARVMEQADYIVRCGGTVNLAAIEGMTL